MINLYDSNICDILPYHLKKQPEVQALGYALMKMNQKVMNYIDKTSVYTTIDEQSEEILDLLALEFRSQYYDDSLSIQTKRAIIKNTLIWYQKAGTVSAVEELITTIFGSGEVEEWFEYGGNPYYFRVRINNSSETSINEFVKMIRHVKNARSHLEDVSMTREINQLIHAGTACRNIKKVTIFEGKKEMAFYQEQHTYTGTSQAIKRVNKVLPKEKDINITINQKMYLSALQRPVKVNKILPQERDKDFTINQDIHFSVLQKSNNNLKIYEIGKEILTEIQQDLFASVMSRTLKHQKIFESKEIEKIIKNETISGVSTGTKKRITIKEE